MENQGDRVGPRGVSLARITKAEGKGPQLRIFSLQGGGPLGVRRPGLRPLWAVRNGPDCMGRQILACFNRPFQRELGFFDPYGEGMPAGPALWARGGPPAKSRASANGGNSPVRGLGPVGAVGGPS